MNLSKVSVKVGIVEFSGEGDEEWLGKQLDKVLERIPELLKIEFGGNGSSGEGSGGRGRSESGMGKGTGGESLSGLSVLNIAGKLNSKSGTDVAVAAAAYLHFILAKPSFSRDELSAAMKEATGIYTNNMLSNLTKTLAQLEKSGTFKKSSSSYSLSAAKVTELHALLSK